MTESVAGLLADFVLILHLLFIGFAAAGGLLALRWPRAAWLHLPTLVWAAVIEWSGGRCPLTPLENWLLARAGSGAYEGDFVERYLTPVIYPPGLDRDLQVVLVVLLLVANAAIYALVLRSLRRRAHR